ncbi:UDP-N-acetylglucosamine--undecaprenyl-phosphate N-acetylglucosaminephosphotransferase [Vibrio rotiferianus]|uniref:UDP-N-acetylglucosamine--undecaprenyl-phosphate N-acetylglucosaminephosphotransferase n=1 Tax=Vibrio rotiferianus TaxID=190895 RepID=UPI0028956BB5|nr:UDP-N-acetylglucosamine--undecaprenyl-phosphate N-acetylglucosaminephosphotransferase [Vibrio rotiferianus]
MIIDLSFVFISSIAFLFILRKAAKKIGLVDKPNARKLHQGQIPLIGGISICLVLVQYLFNNQDVLPHALAYCICVITLTFVGAIDDRFDISFKLRFAIQAGISLIMMEFAGVKLLSLGNMFGFGNIHLDGIGAAITVLAVIGAINAFNMVDGIDGLLGGLSTVSVGSLAVMFFFHGLDNLAQFCLIICAATLPYILFNLGAFGKKRKVFMGDAGSMLIGFTVIWLLLLGSQDTVEAPIRPVTALWLIAIPLMDMTAVMLRRIRKGQSPFKPDREHLHHIFQRIGLNSTQTLIAICSISFTLAAIGMVGDLLGIEEYIMFYGFLIIFFAYQQALNKAWVISSKVKQFRSRNTFVKQPNTGE